MRLRDGNSSKRGKGRPKEVLNDIIKKDMEVPRANGRFRAKPSVIAF